MNYEQAKGLSDEALRIKVAELYGWKRRLDTWSSPQQYADGVALGGEKHWMTFAYSEMLPDYPTDQNAMIEVLKELTNANERCEYNRVLYIILEGWKMSPNDWGWLYHNAPARDRAIAFVCAKTM